MDDGRWRGRNWRGCLPHALFATHFPVMSVTPDFDAALAAAAALPDLPGEEFDQMAKEMSVPLPPAW